MNRSTSNRPVLSGWKEIAQYLGCGVRTAQRWERSGLPVLRPVSGKLSHVLALPQDIERWLQSNGGGLSEVRIPKAAGLQLGASEPNGSVLNEQD